MKTLRRIPIMVALSLTPALYPQASMATEGAKLGPTEVSNTKVVASTKSEEPQISTDDEVWFAVLQTEVAAKYPEYFSGARSGNRSPSGKPTLFFKAGTPSNVLTSAAGSDASKIDVESSGRFSASEMSSVLDDVVAQVKRSSPAKSVVARSKGDGVSVDVETELSLNENERSDVAAEILKRHGKSPKMSFTSDGAASERRLNTSINGGVALTNSLGALSCTASFPAATSYGGSIVYGVMTAAHCPNPLYYYSGGTNLLSFWSESKYVNGVYQGDLQFNYVSSPNTASSVFQCGHTTFCSLRGAVAPYDGLNVGAWGQASAARTMTVQYPDVSESFGNYGTINHLFENYIAAKVSIPGDSGGPVFMGNSTTRYYAVGSTTGSSQSTGREWDSNITKLGSDLPGIWLNNIP